MDEHPERRWYQGRVGAFAKCDCAVLEAALFAEDQRSGRIAWPLLTLADGVTVRALNHADHAGVPDLMQPIRRTGGLVTFYSRNLRPAMRPHNVSSLPFHSSQDGKGREL